MLGGGLCMHVLILPRKISEIYDLAGYCCNDPDLIKLVLN